MLQKQFKQLKTNSMYILKAKKKLWRNISWFYCFRLFRQLLYRLRKASNYQYKNGNDIYVFSSFWWNSAFMFLWHERNFLFVKHNGVLIHFHHIWLIFDASCKRFLCTFCIWNGFCFMYTFIVDAVFIVW